MNSKSKLPPKVTEMIGRTVDWRHDGKPTITGKILAARKFIGQITNMKTMESQDGYEFLIMPIDGSIPIWTNAFPLRD